MTPYKQDINKEIGNCMITCFASYLDEDPKSLPEIEKLFNTKIPKDFWWNVTNLFWNMMGYTYHYTTSHSKCLKEIGSDYYFVTGLSDTDSMSKHMCIFKEGNLCHDPHPDNIGLLTQEYYEYVIPIE